MSSTYAGSIAQSDSTAWYAVQVRTLREKSVAQLLGQRGYQYFLPLRQRWNAQTREMTTTALFPGYLFCYLDLLDRRAPVISTPGVIRLVGFGGRPMPVPCNEIKSLQAIVDSTLPFKGTPFGRIGSKVRIISGPLRGTEGYLESLEEQSRLVVQITLLQRAVSVEIDQSCAIPCLETEPRAMVQFSGAN